MRESKDFLGKQIISITDGRLLGTVRDIYLDQGLNWLTGIHVGREGLIKRKALVISRESVVVFGVDAILVKHGDVIVDDREFAAAAAWLRLNDLKGREVDTPGGTRVATVGDIVVDQEANVVAIRLARVFVEGPIAEKSVVPREAIIDPGSEDGIMTIDLVKAEQSDASPPRATVVPGDADIAPAEDAAQVEQSDDS